jgi:hypothetical protein
MFLNDNYTSYHKFDAKGFAATEATIASYETQGRGAELAIAKASTEFRGKSLDTLYVRRAQMDPAAPKTVLVPVGAYLIEGGVIVHREDPGVCGTETQQLAEDGVTVEREIGPKLDAPKARLFQMIIDGVLEGTLPWALVLIGVFIAIMMELCGVPALAFAVGVYLPISTSSSIFLGGLVRKWTDKRSKLSDAEQESSPGVLFSSGLIAGGALVAILSCALVAPKTVVNDDGSRTDTTWVEHIHKSYGVDLNMANHLFGPDETIGGALARLHLDAKPVLAFCDESSLAMNARQFLDVHNWWGLGCFLFLGLFLYAVARGKPKPPPPTTAGPM